MLVFSAYGTLAPSSVRCGLPGSVGCPGGILGTAAVPLSSGEQWFTVTMYDWGFWVVDASTGANETNAWNVFEGWTVHVNATSLKANAAVGGTAYHGLGVELNATGQQLLSLAAPVGQWTQGSFVAPNAVYHHQHIWCTIQCGPGHGGQQAWILNVIPAVPSPKATASANTTGGRAPLAVAFTGTAASGTPPYNVSWNFGDGTPTDYGLTASHLFTLGGNYSAQFQVTDSKGMSASASVNILVNSTAPLAATLSASRNSAIVPYTTTFSVIAHGGAPPYAINWSFGDGTGGPGANLTSHLYSAPGLYAVVATVKDSSGTVVRALASVTALPPLAYFPVTVTATPASGSTGVLVQLNATPTGGSGPYSYLWVFGDGSSGTGAGVQHQFNQTGSYEVNVFIDDAAGRVGTTAVNIPVTVASSGGGGDDGGGNDSVATPAPAATNTTALTLFPLATPTHGGSPLVVNATASVEAGTGTGETIAWTFGDGTTGTGPSVSHQFASVGTYDVTVSATDSGGNTGTATTVVRVLPLEMSLVANRSAGDAPFSVTTAATILGGSGRYGVVSWSWGDGSSSSGDLANHTFPANWTGPLTVRASTTDSNGAPVDANVTLLVNPALVATLTAVVPTGGTPPVVVEFRLAVAGGSGSYETVPLWTFGDNSSTRGGSPTNHSYDKLADYRVTVVTNDSLGTVTVATAWVNLSTTAPTSGSPGGGSPPWSLTGVRDSNKAALVLIGMVAVSGLALLYRRRRAKPSTSPARSPAVPSAVRRVKVPAASPDPEAVR